ncbi:MAG: methylated-DNA--[protein]-cysteine S-methyltransferase [Acidobacteriia bacterium]|nr:methylated-DNA--[protein]-cysteine S-methyltransferase [Terriglobia bacterium]
MTALARATKSPRFATEDDRWDAVVRRDASADGLFYYSVRTVGVYCRPSCAGRLALRKNVSFHASCDDAEKAGFRACKRCRPNEAIPVRASKVSKALLAGLRAEDAHSLIRFDVGQCSLGAILVAMTEKGICAILLGDDPGELARDLQNRFPASKLTGGDPKLEESMKQVVDFVEAPNAGFNLPLDVRGTAFQQQVWKALRRIPAGRTASYTEIAGKIGSPKAVRAVARACAANAIAVVIPCHRVVRGDGSLSGYRWGVERKRLLISREAALRGNARWN